MTVNELGKYIRENQEEILSPTLLETKIKDGAGLLNPLNYYLRKVGI